MVGLRSWAALVAALGLLFVSLPSCECRASGEDEWESDAPTSDGGDSAWWENLQFLSNDFYGALGLPRKASMADVKKAYRTLSRQLHPDRVGLLPKDEASKIDPQRFIDISEAYQVLSKPVKKAQYDEFLDEIPARFRPVYHLRRRQADPFLTTFVALLTLLILMSVAQSQQFKRQRRRALASEFFHQALAASIQQATMAKGQAEEADLAQLRVDTERALLAEFEAANPEMLRTWKHTLGGRLLLLPLRLVGLVKPDELLLDRPKLSAQDSGDEDDGNEQAGPASYGDDEEDEESGDAQLRRADAKSKRKAERKQQEREQNEARRLQQETKRQETMAQKASERAEQRAAFHAEQDRVQAKEAQRVLQVRHKKREKELEERFDEDALASLIDICEVADNPESEIATVLGSSVEDVQGARGRLLQSLRNGALDEEEFWQDIFDDYFSALDKVRAEQQRLEQEALEEEERNRIRQLMDDSDDNSAEEDEEEEDASSRGEPRANGPEWDDWLAAKQAAKEQRKQKVKEDKQKKAAANKDKVGSKKPAGKKERRR